MNLLEIVSKASSRAHDAKEYVTTHEPKHDGCNCDKGDYCRAQLPACVTAFRGGQPVVAMTLEDLHFAYPVRIAARLYHADVVAVTVDGRDTRTDRPVIVVTAANRAGDELWRVEPYSIAPDGRSIVWWPAEVPDRHPVLDDSDAGAFVKVMNQPNIGPPPVFNHLTPGMSFEERRAMMDIGITRQIVKHANDPWHNIIAITLASAPGTDRAKVLDMADDPRLWL